MGTAAKPEKKALWEPSEKQTQFLAADEDEILYGGAAGGGKSDALVIDAMGLQQQAVGKAHYRAILFRKTYNELEELIDRSKEIYPSVVRGAKWAAQRSAWEFPSGAKIRFRHFDNPKDRFKYQGHAYHWVGWDELTQHESQVGYEYMISRLRARGDNDTLKRYVRAGCNPGGFGHEWVKDRWCIPDDGSAVSTAIDLEDDDGSIERWHQRFIPARVTDNKYLANTNYTKQLRLLNDQDRKALKDGRWDVVEVVGAILADELNDMNEENRICNIPIERGIPVTTFWDLGRNDEMAVWMMQRVGLEDRYIGYMEARFKSIPWWGKAMKAWADKRGLVYDAHYMPHDINVTDLSANNVNRKTLFENTLPGGVVIAVPRIESLREGIDMLREYMSRIYIDRKACGQGIKCLGNYRRRWDEKQQTFLDLPMRNWARNGTDALRQAAQGYVPPRIARSSGYNSSRKTQTSINTL